MFSAFNSSMSLARLLAKIGRRREEAVTAPKYDAWKLAVAAAMKASTTATNRWLFEQLHMGNLHEVSRRVSVWTRDPDAGLARKLGLSAKRKA